MIFNVPEKPFPLRMVTVRISLWGNYSYCYIKVYRNETIIGDVLSDEGMEGSDGTFKFAIGDKIRLEAYNAKYMEHQPKDSIEVIDDIIDLEGIIRGETVIYYEFY